eukprot:9037240-Pyramimonas_sp.AAC.1
MRYRVRQRVAGRAKLLANPLFSVKCYNYGQVFCGLRRKSTDRVINIRLLTTSANCLHAERVPSKASATLARGGEHASS